MTEPSQVRELIDSGQRERSHEEIARTGVAGLLRGELMRLAGNPRHTGVVEELIASRLESIEADRACWLSGFDAQGEALADLCRLPAGERATLVSQARSSLALLPPAVRVHEALGTVEAVRANPDATAQRVVEVMLADGARRGHVPRDRSRWDEALHHSAAILAVGMEAGPAGATGVTGVWLRLPRFLELPGAPSRWPLPASLATPFLALFEAMPLGLRPPTVPPRDERNNPTAQ